MIDFCYVLLKRDKIIDNGGYMSTNYYYEALVHNTLENKNLFSVRYLLQASIYGVSDAYTWGIYITNGKY